MSARPRRVSESPAQLAARVWKPAELLAYDGPLLLDTHAWIWHLEDDHSQWARETSTLLERSGAHARLVVCDMSYWEVAAKSAKGKLRLSVDAAVWLQRAETAADIRYQPATRPVLLQSTRLAGPPHGDPVDRILMAKAQLDGVPLVTADRHIIEYARKYGNTPVVDVRP
jgi:PIN domain nuclease of toxin-antitoxin system